jgi:arginyl-tRNA synthetase
MKKKEGKSLKKIEAVQEALVYEEELPLSLNGDDLLKAKLGKIVERAVMVSFPKILNPVVKIEYPSSRENGDYACNIAMQLSKELKKNPREIAEQIIKNIDKTDFEVEIAGPGFINFYIKEGILKDELRKILKEKDGYGKREISKEKTIVLDYSSPNIAKPLGVHHLLTTVIGQALYNIFTEIGFNCQGINHIGDWGTQFGKLIYAYRKWGDKKTVEKAPIDELLKLYVKFHDEAEKDPKIEDEGRAEFLKFEEGDKENRKLWKWFVEESLKEIEKTYEKLGGIHFDHVQGESFYEDKMEEIIKDGKERKVFVKGEEGAYVVRYDDPNIAPFVVQKKDGATLYSTRDFATLKYRIGEWHPLRILYVVDLAQSLHFKQLFTASKRFPWYHGEGVHVNFGRMHMKSGKMSTRKGNVVLLDEVIDEAVKRSLAIVNEKSPDLGEKEKVAHVIGVGAIKYSILSQNRTTDITFDWDKMLSLDGNSAPYLQYTYARARSILRKREEEIEGDRKDGDGVPGKIQAVLRLFPKYRESLNFAAQEYKPNILCAYLYDLAQDFNSFYNVVPVLKAENKNDRNFRLKVVEATSQILKNGLKVLGIEVVEEM